MTLKEQCFMAAPVADSVNGGRRVNGGQVAHSQRRVRGLGQRRRWREHGFGKLVDLCENGSKQLGLLDVRVAIAACERMVGTQADCITLQLNSALRQRHFPLALAPPRRCSR
jgi:hypothetical protein